MRNKITLLSLGGLVEDANRAFAKVCENIGDPCTANDVERKIHITIRIAPDARARCAAINYQIKTDLAGPVPGTVSAWLDLDEKKQLALFDSNSDQEHFTFRASPSARGDRHDN